MEDIFDKIIAGEIPSYKIYEDNNVIVILDISQATKGHTLLIPKKHLENIYEYSDNDAQKILSVIPKISRALKSALDDTVGLNIISNNEIGAGQTVMHSHFHLIPRYEDDDFETLEGIDNSNNYSQEDLVLLSRKIAKEIK